MEPGGLKAVAQNETPLHTEPINPREIMPPAQAPGLLEETALPLSGVMEAFDKAFAWQQQQQNPERPDQEEQEEQHTAEGHQQLQAVAPCQQHITQHMPAAATGTVTGPAVHAADAQKHSSPSFSTSRCAHCNKGTHVPKATSTQPLQDAAMHTEGQQAAQCPICCTQLGAVYAPARVHDCRE